MENSPFYNRNVGSILISDSMERFMKNISSVAYSISGHSTFGLQSSDFSAKNAARILASQFQEQKASLGRTLESFQAHNREKEKILEAFSKQNKATSIAFHWPVPPHIEALRLLKKHGDAESIENLTERLALEVIYCDLPASVGGFIETGDHGPYIAVNSRHSSYEQEYTIAHEIGHHILGHISQRTRNGHELEGEAEMVVFILQIHWNPIVSQSKRLSTFLFEPFKVSRLNIYSE